MNDFLQSLRTGNAKPQRAGMTRKTYDHAFHSANQHFQYHSGTSQPAQNIADNQVKPNENVQTAAASILLNTIENLSHQVEKLASNQGDLIAAQEKTAHVIERQTIAIEKIVNHLELLPPVVYRKMTRK